MRRRLAIVEGFVAGLLFFSHALTAQDPPTPPGGFPIAQRFDQPVRWSDGATTLADVRLPAVAPPASGWPVVVVLHGLGGTRRTAYVIAEARAFAARGYLSIAYDARASSGESRCATSPTRCSRSSAAQVVTSIRRASRAPGSRWAAGPRSSPRRGRSARCRCRAIAPCCRASRR